MLKSGTLLTVKHSIKCISLSLSDSITQQSDVIRSLIGNLKAFGVILDVNSKVSLKLFISG